MIANDSDVDGDILTATALSAPLPAHGAATLASNNVVTHTPAPDFCGIDTFGYTVADPSGLSDTGLVSISVTCVNDPPVLADIADPTQPWNDTASIPLTATDADTGDTASFTLVAGPTGASIQAVGPGVFAVVWTPTSTQIGVHALRVRATDGSGATDEESFTVTVSRRATVLTYTGATNGQYSDPAAVGASLLDVDGDPISGATVTFKIGTRTSSATSGSTGVASGNVLLGGPAGPSSVLVSFAGNPYTASSTSATFTILPETILTTFAGNHLTVTSGTSSSTRSWRRWPRSPTAASAMASPLST